MPSIVPDEVTYEVFDVVSSTTGPFNFGFQHTGKPSLRVTVDNVDVDFNLTPGSVVDAAGYDGGSFSLLVAVANARVVIYRLTTVERDANLSGSNLTFAGINGVLNGFAYILQEMRRDINRALLANFGESGDVVDPDNVAAVAAIADAVAIVARIDAEILILAAIQTEIAELGAVGSTQLLALHAALSSITSLVSNLAEVLEVQANIADVITVAGYVNDGIFDAQTLDGQLPAFYLAWSNLTGVPDTFDFDLDANKSVTGDWTFSGNTQVVKESAGFQGAEFTLYHDSVSPAVDDYVAAYIGQGVDSGGNKTTYGSLTFAIDDTTNGSEDGYWVLAGTGAGVEGARYLTNKGNVLKYGTNTVFHQGNVSAFAQTILDDADAAAARSTLGLGSLATQSPTGTADNTTFLRGDNTWAAPAGGGGGDLLAANNLSDLASASTARTNLGLQNGATTVLSAFILTLVDDADAAAARSTLGLGSLATLNTVNNGNWSGTALAVANGGTGATDAATARTNLGLAIGSNVQAYNANLTTWAGKTAPSGTVVGTSDTQTLTNKQMTTIELGHASDTTLSRLAAGNMGIEGKSASRVTSGTAANSGLISWGTGAPGTLAEGEIYLKHA